MAGWNLKEGKLKDEILDENERWKMLERFFSKKTVMKNLYKIFLLKSLVILSKKDNSKDIGLFEDLTKVFAELYWDNKIFSNINTTIFNGISKISKQESIINEIYNMSPNSKYVNFKNLREDLKKKYLIETKELLKTNVIGALYNDFDSRLYSFNLKNEELMMSESFNNFFFENKNKILELLEYREVEFLKISETNQIKIEKYIQDKLNLKKYSVDFYEIIKNEILKKLNK